jgi:hypothetical protein
MARETIRILSPVGKVETTTLQLAPRIKDMVNADLGFLDNRKPNAKALLGAIEAALKAEHSTGRTVWRQKPFSGFPAPAEAFDELAQCQAVIVGVGD